LELVLHANHTKQNMSDRTNAQTTTNVSGTDCYCSAIVCDAIREMSRFPWYVLRDILYS